MNVIVDFKYGEPVIATIFDEYGNQFMKSEVKVKIPSRPFYDSDENKFLYKDTQGMAKSHYLKWKNKVYKVINKAILKSLSEHLYGTVNIHINMEKHHGL